MITSKQRTIRRMLYEVCFPYDPIAEYCDRLISEIVEKYRERIAVYDDALRKFWYDDYSFGFTDPCSASGCGGNGRATSYSQICESDDIDIDKVIWDVFGVGEK